MASPVTTGGNGLAIIISNDYQNTDLKELSETHKDGEKMADVFLKLKYTIKRCKNVKMDCLQEILRDVTKPSKLYPETYRCIVFVFSGHGNLLEKEQLSFICMQDCSPVVISEIVKQFLPNSSPLIAKLPKVFLFDSCLGDKDMCQEAVVVPRGGQGSATSNFSVTGKGGTVLETISLPPNGNYILAHATSNGYKAFQLDNFGGLWINMVAEQILHSPTESVANILTNANKHLLDLYQDPIHKGAMTQPHYVSYLQDTLRFLPLPEDHRTDPPVQISFNDTVLAEPNFTSTLEMASPLCEYPTPSTPKEQTKSSVKQLECVLKEKCGDQEPKIEYSPPKTTRYGYRSKVYAPQIGYAEGEECPSKKMAKESAAAKALELLAMPAI